MFQFDCFRVKISLLCFLSTIIISGISGQTKFNAISCWGDSKTQGGQETENVSYPSVLQAMIDSAGYQMRVYNFGATGEFSTEIMQRQGALPLIIQPFVIPASSEEEVLVTINSRLRVPDAGCNPCVVAGIEGSIRHDWADADQKTFYFKRAKDGDPVVINDETRVITDAMLHHRNDLLIMDIGYNGGWHDDKDWINQYRQMVDYSKCKEYIVIGRASHWYGTYPEREEMFQSTFGNRYINLTKYYIEHGLSDAGLEPTEDDLKDINSGIPPRSLFYDEHHENDAGYAVKAKVVFNRLQELGIFSGLTNIKNPAITDDLKNTSYGIYTLQGQKIGKITKGGVYIVNGKKKYIKN